MKIIHLTVLDLICVTSSYFPKDFVFLSVTVIMYFVCAFFYFVNYLD